jgi:hypothetical protein
MLVVGARALRLCHVSYSVGVPSQLCCCISLTIPEPDRICMDIQQNLKIGSWTWL